MYVYIHIILNHIEDEAVIHKVHYSPYSHISRNTSTLYSHINHILTAARRI